MPYIVKIDLFLKNMSGVCVCVKCDYGLECVTYMFVGFLLALSRSRCQHYTPQTFFLLRQLTIAKISLETSCQYNIVFYSNCNWHLRKEQHGIYLCCHLFCIFVSLFWVLNSCGTDVPKSQGDEMPRQGLVWWATTSAVPIVGRGCLRALLVFLVTVVGEGDI